MIKVDYEELEGISFVNQCIVAIEAAMEVCNHSPKLKQSLNEIKNNLESESPLKTTQKQQFVFTLDAASEFLRSQNVLSKLKLLKERLEEEVIQSYTPQDLKTTFTEFVKSKKNKKLIKNVVLQERKKIHAFGICFGVQTITLNPGEMISDVELLSQQNQKIPKRLDPLLVTLLDYYNPKTKIIKNCTLDYSNLGWKF